VSTLTLSVPDPAAAPQAVVRDWQLRFVKRVHPGEAVELEPGRYVVSLTAPGGEETVRSVELAAGDDATVEFAQAPAAPAPALESFTEAAVVPWHARLLAWRDGAPEPATDAPDAAALLLARGRPAWVQLAAAGAVPRNVLLPERWTLRLSPAGSPAVAPPPDPVLAALAGFLVSGQVREAADLGEQAMEMLRGKVADPTGATVGGYALLRMRDVERMHDWPYNLSRWFDWLPDGAVLAAELALLQDDRAEAERQLTRAAERGVPLFAEGLSLLGRRVREGLVDTEPARRLAALTPFQELGQLTVVLPGRNPLDPAGSQQPVRELSAGDGWRPF
jgi:hypothetical protein